MKKSNIFTMWLENATLYDWITNGAAVIAVFFLALVIYGFRRYVKRPPAEPIDYMGTGIWLLAMNEMVRLVWWDLIPDFMGQPWRAYGFTSSHFNWIFNFVVVLAAWNMLKGFYLLVDELAPGHYNIITAVFYPRRFRLSPSSRKGTE